jgi:hypothetical protein
MTTIRATRPAADESSAYFATYIVQVPDGDVVDTLERGIQHTQSLLAGVPEARGGFRYQPGKWSIKELVDHLSDTERVFAYRLLTFARGDAGPLPGFDENTFAPAAESDRRPLAEVLAELVAVRMSTIALLKGLPDAAWTRRGVASGNPLSVRATAWIIAGHEIHHRKVLEERYLAAR